MKRFVITTRPSVKESGHHEDVGSLRVINIPVTKLEPNRLFSPSAVQDFEPDIAIFTSTYGAEIFLKEVTEEMCRDVRAIAIGKKTAATLKERYPDIEVPDTETSEGVTKLLGQALKEKDRVVLFVSSRTNGLISKYLDDHNVRCLSIELYAAEPVKDGKFFGQASKEGCLGVVFTSSYEVNVVFNEILSEEEKSRLAERIKFFAIGRTTAGTMEKLGVEVSHPLGESDLEKLLKDIEKTYLEPE